MASQFPLQTLAQICTSYQHFIRTHLRLFQSLSICQMLINIHILNAWIWQLSKAKNLPQHHSTWPLKTWKMRYTKQHSNNCFPPNQHGINFLEGIFSAFSLFWRNVFFCVTKWYGDEDWWLHGKWKGWKFTKYTTECFLLKLPKSYQNRPNPCSTTSLFNVNFRELIASGLIHLIGSGFEAVSSCSSAVLFSSSPRSLLNPKSATFTCKFASNLEAENEGPMEAKVTKSNWFIILICVFSHAIPCS